MSETALLLPSTADTLVLTAIRLGASDAKILTPESIPVDPDLVRFCSSPPCPNYNTSANCPPNGRSAREFAAARRWYEKAIVFKIDVPVSALQSDDRFPYLRKIHVIASKLEQEARKTGAVLTFATATGGCKELFCTPYSRCQKLAEGVCRFPDLAKQSMSGLGVNFFALAETIGWDIRKITADSAADDSQTGILAGIVLVA